MSQDFLQFVGDGVTREFVIQPSHTSIDGVKVDGVTTPFTQTAWNKIRLGVTPVAGAIITVSYTQTTSTPSAPSGGDTGGGDGGTSGSAVTAYPGEVRSFAVGQVPEGWQQIDGPTAIQNPAPADLLAKHLHAGTTHPTSTKRRLIRNGDKLYWQLWSTTSVFTLQEVDVNHNPVGAPWTINTGVYDNTNSPYPIPLADGAFLRYGGRNTSTNAFSTVVTRFNTNRSTSALLSAPQNLRGVAAQAGDGKVYGSAETAGLLVAFDPAANTYDPQTYQGPFVPQSMHKLADGNLLLINTEAGTGQYCVFDITSKVFSTPVAFDCEGANANGGMLLSDGQGATVTLKTINGVRTSVLVLFDPLSTSVTYTPLAVMVATATHMELNPLNQRITLYHPTVSAIYATFYELLADYVPQGTVRAIKL